ncbi:IS3 family transposase, partial [Klebsiella aerogenes]|uniref:IS3 family transposase n=1 Tax=Klebsiella aerogenes TaxID=548 RepID=UPI001D0DFCD3
MLQRELIDRNEFSSYYEAKLMIDGYVDFYNNRRLHGLLKMRRPQQVWDSWYTNNTGSTNGERMSTQT